MKVVATTGSGPVCATDRNFVRFFSYSGMQTFVITAESAPMSMAGSRNYLFLIFHGIFSFLISYSVAAKTTLF